MTDCHGPDLHPLIGGDKGGPLVSLAEQAGHGHLQHLVLLPEDHADLDAITIAKRLRGPVRAGQLDDHIDALLLDAQRRHLGSGRVSAIYICVEIR